MVATALVENKIKDGERLIRTLDRAKFKVSAAFWYYFEEPDSWRLVIASPLVDSIGAGAAYQKLFSIPGGLRKRGLIRVTSLSPSEVTLVSPKDPLVRALATQMEGAFLSNTVVGGTYVTGAYVYRTAAR